MTSKVFRHLVAQAKINILEGNSPMHLLFNSQDSVWMASTVEIDSIIHCAQLQLDARKGYRLCQ